MLRPAFQSGPFAIAQGDTKTKATIECRSEQSEESSSNTYCFFRSSGFAYFVVPPPFCECR